MHGAPASGVPLWPLHDGNVPFEPPRHGGKPALGRHAVGVHNQQDFAAGFLESRFQGPLLGALYLGEVRVQMDGAELVPVGRDEIVQDFPRGIGGAVIDADNLVLPCIFLGGQGVQGPLQEFFFVSHGDDHGDVGGGAPLVPVRADNSHGKRENGNRINCGEHGQDNDAQHVPKFRKKPFAFRLGLILEGSPWVISRQL